MAQEVVKDENEYQSNFFLLEFALKSEKHALAKTTYSLYQDGSNNHQKFFIWTEEEAALFVQLSQS